MIRPFYLVRHEDVSGVTGNGIVGEGCLFSDGTCTLHWLGRYCSTVVHASLESVRAVHGHEGRTEVRFLDPPHYSP